MISGQKHPLAKVRRWVTPRLSSHCLASLSLIDSCRITGWQTLPAPWTTIPVHIRGGSIIPMQAPLMTINATWASPFTIVVAPDINGRASGSLFYDDGSTLDYTKFIWPQLNLLPNVFTMFEGGAVAGLTPPKVTRVQLLGKHTTPFLTSVVTDLLLTHVPRL
jgi:hypothetical protein